MNTRTMALVPLLVAVPALAQTDTAKARPEPIFTARDAAILAAIGGASVALMQADERIAKGFAKPSVQNNGALDAIATGASYVDEKSLFAASVVAYVGARIAHSRTASDVAFHTGEAVFLTSSVSTVIRGVLGRSRPYITQDTNAFDFHVGKGFGTLSARAYPSIHAATSFATATALVQEIHMRNPHASPLIAPVAYALASLPGLGRMYKDRHWASDVLSGAALGTLIGWKVERYHHSHPGNRLDRIFIGAEPSPTGGGAQALLGVSLPFQR